MAKSAKSFLQELTDRDKAARVKPLNLSRPEIVMDPPVVQELTKELQHHPALVDKLGSLTDNYVTIIGLLAGELEIAVDGYYTEAEILHLAEIVLKRLQEKRVGIVLTGRQ